MTQLVLPSHTNALDSIFGGVIMSWIDICGAIAAQRHAGKEVVTASLDDLSFVAPVYKGWVVNLKGSVNFVSTTSMEVGVRIDAENPKTGEVFHTATAYLTFVAIGSNGKPSSVPPLICETETEKRRFAEGKTRRELRLARRKRSD
ncbi:MAG: acyl-CoA thioesterase [Bdellovibrionaceae bacterium]|nr:acyl-CoA thioesterase [Pseudobdellovibrionaceae bacterium]